MPLGGVGVGRLESNLLPGWRASCVFRVRADGLLDVPREAPVDPGNVSWADKHLFVFTVDCTLHSLTRSILSDCCVTYKIPDRAILTLMDFACYHTENNKKITKKALSSTFGGDGSNAGDTR